jgi:hypothetical protein
MSDEDLLCKRSQLQRLSEFQTESVLGATTYMHTYAHSPHHRTVAVHSRHLKEILVIGHQMVDYFSISALVEDETFLPTDIRRFC